MLEKRKRDLGKCAGLPAKAARPATDTATLPFCAESAIPFTSRTVAIAYSMRSVFSDAAGRPVAASPLRPRRSPVSLNDTARMSVKILSQRHLQCHIQPNDGGDRTRRGAVIQEGHAAHLARVSSNDAEMSTPSGSRPRHRHATTCVGCRTAVGMRRGGRDRGSAQLLRRAHPVQAFLHVRGGR